MLLQQARRFEQIIQGPVQNGPGGTQQKFVTWEDPNKIEKYTRDVQKMATDLINENRKLRKVHINVTT